jgi:hypothetical protein
LLASEVLEGEYELPAPWEHASSWAKARSLVGPYSLLPMTMQASGEGFGIPRHLMGHNPPYYRST